MTGRIDLLTQELFQKNISDCSWKEVRDLAASYPYFAPAQYILAKKSQLENAPGRADGQPGKTLLYYHDPLAFDFFIHPEKYETDYSRKGSPATETIEEILPEENIEEWSQSRAVGFPAEPEQITGSEAGTANEPGTVLNDPEELERGKTPTLLLPEISNDNALVFEPFYTVDYFASQGIKLSQEVATKDQMGKQLKSFTEWLKTMKRAPLAEQEKKIDPVIEKKVASLAAHSLDNTSIITETMAEVWAMQGNREKAIETYHKLITLHPSKKAYYTAKVEKLTKRSGGEKASSE